jgi:hypothetical protein
MVKSVMNVIIQYYTKIISKTPIYIMSKEDTLEVVDTAKRGKSERRRVKSEQELRVLTSKI